MDLALIERLIDLVGRSPIREFELSQDGWRLRLVKAGGARALAPPPEQPLAQEAGDGAPVAFARGAHVIAAGTVGTFYRGPAPDKPPFVAVGDRVDDGQTLGLLEAMKTLIPVEADRAGRIAAVLCADATTVRTGDPLFSLDPVEAR